MSVAGQAVIEIAELKDADGMLEVAAGDRIQATTVSSRNSAHGRFSFNPESRRND